jgi:hypothetical protein
LREVHSAGSALVAGLVLATSCFAWVPVGSDPASLPAAYERLVSILQPGARKTAPANIEKVLDSLPEELLSNFTLVYTSRSPHRDEISPLFPRVVLFTSDAKLLITFTGNPAAPSYNRLEIIFFDNRTSSFHATRFILADAIRQVPALKRDAMLNGATDQYECTRCHGGDVRPIFDSYRLWPGFYGSRADMPDAYADERRDYVRFQAANARRGVYRYLRFPPGSPISPYQDGTSSLAPGEALRFHPNERLGDALTTLNWKRIGRKLASRGDVYQRLRYPLLAGMLGCSALPISVEFDQAIGRALERENTRRLERAGLTGDPEGSRRFRMQELAPGIRQGISEIAYVAKAAGVSRADWSMSFEPLSLGFFDGVLTRPVLYVKEDLLTAMMGELASSDRNFAPFYNPTFVLSLYGYDIGFKLGMREDFSNPELCALLDARAKALGTQALETVERIDKRDELPVIDQKPDAVLKRCGGCHEGNGTEFAGVEIPFTDPVALRRKLHFDRSLRTGQPLLGEILTRVSPRSPKPMPPPSSSPPLKESDRRDLVNYLSHLGDVSQ